MLESITGIGMFAIISDVHSNLEALTTVLADIEKRARELFPASEAAREGLILEL